MPKTLTLELPDDAFSAFRQSPEEFGRERRLAAAIPIREKYVHHVPRQLETVYSRKPEPDFIHSFTYR